MRGVVAVTARALVVVPEDNLALLEWCNRKFGMDDDVLVVRERRARSRRHTLATPAVNRRRRANRRQPIDLRSVGLILPPEPREGSDTGVEVGAARGEAGRGTDGRDSVR